MRLELSPLPSESWSCIFKKAEGVPAILGSFIWSGVPLRHIGVSVLEGILFG